MNWQPIHTAPYDCPILLTWETSDGLMVVSEAWRQMQSLNVEHELGYVLGLNKVIAYFSFDPDGEEVLTYEPTHWCEMPEGPNQKPFAALLGSYPR